MGTIEELKKELKALQMKREQDATIKNLKRQIRTERFGQTRGGKIFNKIANIGDATTRYLSQPNPRTSAGKKKKKPVKTVEQIMARLPQ